MPTTDDFAHDQLLRDLRDLAPPPPTAPLDIRSRDRLELDLIASIEHASSVRRSTRETLGSWGPAVLVAACLAAVVGLGVMALPPTAPGGEQAALPLRAETAAVRALNDLASAALTTEVPTVAEDQFVYVRSTVVTNEGALGGGVRLGAPHEREIWLSQASETADLGLIREHGQDWPFSSGYVAPAGPERPTYRWLSSLPADPDALIAEIAGQQHVESAVSTDQYTFERIGDIISEGLVPPDLSGALFQALTKIPGVEHTRHAEDAVGRRGFGISRTDELSGVTSMWVFRPGSPVPLGTRWYLPGHDSGPGVLFGATAVLERGVAERVGVRPGGAAEIERSARETGTAGA